MHLFMVELRWVIIGTGKALGSNCGASTSIGETIYFRVYYVNGTMSWSLWFNTRCD